MSDWELLVPGIGLTVLGMAGVGLSLAGIAKTFEMGMHAISALMMFMGMIILATGILKDGLPKSNQAKAAALIIVGLAGSIGAFLVGVAEIPSLVIFTGVLFLILIPAAAIAWAAARKSPHFKAITILFSSAAVVGMITFMAFGIVAPQPVEAGVLEKPKEVAKEPEITGPTVDVAIPKRASVEGFKAYEPAEVTVAKGITIVWTNDDNVVHSVTSDSTGLFDSGTIKSKEKYALNTNKLEKGEYGYFCTFHPFMQAKFVVEENEAAGEITTPGGENKSTGEKIVNTTSNTVGVNISAGSSDSKNPEFFTPKEVTVAEGVIVVWTNSDATGHTVTSGNVGDTDTGKIFDSGFPLLDSGKKYQFTFKEKGEYSYFCQVHPWMIGKVIVK
ncbi:MAG: cupredoxin domain-containing protein [Thaumarchaeota archaeon]|nr:cupredoxin domain-containing protein [Nitrososphaerota archaeon]